MRTRQSRKEETLKMKARPSAICGLFCGIAVVASGASDAERNNSTEMNAEKGVASASYAKDGVRVFFLGSHAPLGRMASIRDNVVVTATKGLPPAKIDSRISAGFRVDRKDARR